MRRLAVTLALALLTGSFVAAQSAEKGKAPSAEKASAETPATPEDLRAVLEEWDEALANSDVARLEGLLEEDVLLLPSGRPALEGRRAVLDAYRALFAQYTVRRDLEILEVEVAGDLAFVRGRETFELVPAGAGDRLRTEPRRVLCILRRGEGGGWRFARAMTNRQVAAETATSQP